MTIRKAALSVAMLGLFALAGTSQAGAAPVRPLLDPSFVGTAVLGEDGAVVTEVQYGRHRFYRHHRRPHRFRHRRF